jgi:hypothetical protein
MMGIFMDLAERLGTDGNIAKTNNGVIGKSRKLVSRFRYEDFE